VVENVLWTTLLNIATGMDVHSELESFLAKARTHMDDGENYIDRGWFIKGMICMGWSHGLF
jgi:hypothetical protein